MIPIPRGEGTSNVRVSGQVRGEDNQPIVNTWVGAYDGQQNSNPKGKFREFTSDVATAK